MNFKRIFKVGIKISIVFSILATMLIGASTAVSAAPADCYWVGNGGNWSDATNHWATSSGGAPGAGNLPDSTSSVHFDANSFSSESQSVILNIDASCKDIDWTGVTNTPTLTHDGSIHYLYIYGSLTFVENMVFTPAGNLIPELRANTPSTFTTAGHSFKVISIRTSATLTQQDTLNVDNYVQFFQGTWDTNDQTINCPNWTFVITGSAAKTLMLGSSTLNLYWWNYNGSNLTLTANTATINNSNNFTGGGITTYNTVNLTGATSTITGNNTFAELCLARADVQTITFTDGSTQTVNTFTKDAGTNIKILQGSGVGGWDIVKSGGGDVEIDYISVSYFAASPADTWLAGINSIDGGNNTNWEFSPETTIAAASDITSRTAILNGLIDKLGTETSLTVTFEYGTTVAYGSTINASQSPMNGAEAYSVTIGNLAVNQEYHFRGKIVGDNFTVYTADNTFTTLGMNAFSKELLDLIVSILLAGVIVVFTMRVEDPKLMAGGVMIGIIALIVLQAMLQ